METDYAKWYDYNADEYALPASYFGGDADQEFTNIMPKDFDTEKFLQLFRGPSMTEKPELGRSARATSTGNFPAEDVEGMSMAHCAINLPVIMAVLTATGMAFCTLIFLDIIFRRKKNRNTCHYVHVFIANFFVLLPLPFAIATRLEDRWKFGNTWYKMMAVTFNALQTVCALQLAYLVIVPCREIIGRRKSSSAWRLVVNFAIWIIAFATAWPCAVYQSTLADVIMGGSMIKELTTGASLFVKLDVSLSFILPTLVTAVCIIAVIFDLKQNTALDRKVPPDIIQSVSDSACLFLLYFLCWLPYRAMRIKSLTMPPLYDCSVHIDITLAIGLSFSTVMPITFYYLGAKSRRQMDEISSSHKYPAAQEA